MTQQLARSQGDRKGRPYYTTNEPLKPPRVLGGGALALSGVGLLGEGPSSP
ncbi:MAG: hypothetical protein ACJ788_03640 [Ktedonobacteraceae bacterium]|jgi:hypothetical protein